MTGQLIRTTGEHPFYAYDKGGTPAQELTPQDWILTDSGDWKPVNEIWNTGELETVYNLRVADHHTYFVGDEHWGWSAWVHNTYKVALGIDTFLPSFARKHNAKYYIEWKPEYFDVPDVMKNTWDPKDNTQGVNSKFASAVRWVVDKSEGVYFNLEGFNLDYWRILAAKAGATFGSLFIGGIKYGSTTAWELIYLINCSGRHSAIRFILGEVSLNYEQSKTYAINHFAPKVRAEIASDAN